MLFYGRQKIMPAFDKKYLIFCVILFLTEVLIALFIKDTIVRPFAGDVLVVILIYCFVRIFLKYSYSKTAFGVLLFAFAVEILQYFDYVELLGLENNRVISVVLGRTFEWLDFAAYSAGFLIILAVEKFARNRENHHNL
jgi:hypothetical protein